MHPATHTDRKTLAVWREPFALGSPKVAMWKDGATILDMIVNMPFLPDNFLEDGIVIVEGERIPTETWDKFVPTAAKDENELSAVTFHMPMQGGGGGGGRKNVFSIVAAVALSAVSYGISSGALAAQTSATLGASFGLSAAAGAKLLGLAVSLTGSLVLGALSGPPSASRASSGVGQDDGSGSVVLSKASLTGNILEPNTSVPRVIGTRRVYPPFGYEPITEYVGQDEYVNATYVLAGPHKLEDVRIGLAGISPDERDSDIRIQMSEGFPDSDPIVIPDRQGRTFPLNTELSVHGVNPEFENLFVGPLPVYHAMSTAESPDEVWLHMQLYGLIKQSDIDASVRIPLRIRMRKIGETDWRDLPEVHYMDNTQSQKRVQIKFLFTTFSPGLSAPPISRGFVEAHKNVPGQNVEPTNSGYTADSYFSAGSGDDVYSASTVGTTKVKNMSLEADTVTFYLHPDDWEPGAYDIEIKRGAAFLDTSFTPATYTYSGSVLDFFYFRSSSEMPLSREGLLDRFGLIRCVSIRNREAIKQRNLAMINVRARNRSVDRLSVLASGYVRDFNGTDWNTIATTSNPAAHYRDVMIGSLNFDPIPEDIVDLESIENWYERCETDGHTCDMVVESSSVSDTLRLLASCGFARPYQSEVWGVIQDYDRSAETPIQVFSSRNSNGLSWKKAFPRLPAGFRINYSDVNYGFGNRQVTVRRTGAPESDARLEQTTYEGLTRLEKVMERGRFDLKQAQLRSAIYSLSVSSQAIRCRKGSLVGINHDILSVQTGSARILETVLDEDGQVAGVVLDSEVNVIDTPYFEDVDNVNGDVVWNNLGLKTGITVVKTNGQLSTYPISNETGSHTELTLTTPVDDDVTDGSFFDKGKVKQIATGCLVFIGNVTNQYKRCIVTDIQSGRGLSANLTLLDEAPALWS